MLGRNATFHLLNSGIRRLDLVCILAASISTACWYIAGAEYSNRYLFGPRLARSLTGSARSAFLEERAGWLNRQDGGAVLLAYLKKKFTSKQCQQGSQITHTK